MRHRANVVRLLLLVVLVTGCAARGFSEQSQDAPAPPVNPANSVIDQTLQSTPTQLSAASKSPEAGDKPWMNRPVPTDLASEDIAIAQSTQDTVTCLASRGVAAKVIPPKEGGWGVDVQGPADLAASVDVRAAVEACQAEIGSRTAPNTPEIAEQKWQRQMEIYNCLKDNKFNVTEPPSKETWIAQLLAGSAQWSAYSGIDGGSFSRASQQCPQQR